MQKITIVLLLCVIYSFEVPGIQQREYIEGEELSVFINEMTSESTQIPYDYYDLEICKPESTEN